jgi:hypothetical protein
LTSCQGVGYKSLWESNAELNDVRVMEYGAVANEIYVDPNATSAAVIQVAGECYQRVGGVPVAPNVSSVDGTFETCDQCEGGYSCQVSGYVSLSVTGVSLGSCCATDNDGNYWLWQGNPNVSTTVKTSAAYFTNGAVIMASGGYGTRCPCGVFSRGSYASIGYISGGNIYIKGGSGMTWMNVEATLVPGTYPNIGGASSAYNCYTSDGAITISADLPTIALSSLPGSLQVIGDPISNYYISGTPGVQCPSAAYFIPNPDTAVDATLNQLPPILCGNPAYCIGVSYSGSDSAHTVFIGWGAAASGSGWLTSVFTLSVFSSGTGIGWIGYSPTLLGKYTAIPQGQLPASYTVSSA